MQSAFRGTRRLSGLFIAGTLVALLCIWLGAGAASSAAAGHAHHHGRAHVKKASVSISSQPWGDADGHPVRLWTLKSGNGMTVNITNYGGVVQSIWVPDRHGHTANVVLGFSKLSDYVNDFEHQPWPASGGSGDTYFGAIIGRYANRIANASFTLNGTTYTLPANNGPNTLHGGPNSWNTKVWSASEKVGAKSVSLILKYTDPDGYNGFPGEVTTTVIYTVNSSNALEIHYHSTTTKPTVINLTNHSYFNLAGEASGPIYNQLLQLNANTFTPTDANLIPTGQFVPVAGTPFDFRTLHPIGQHILDASMPWGDQLTTAHGYDHNWVLNGPNGQLKEAAVAVDPASGRKLTTFTTEPGVQVYTGNFLVGDLVGTSGHIYRQTSAFTLETQHYPDSPHHIGQAGWPSVVLNPGHPFNSTTIFRFGVAG